LYWPVPDSASVPVGLGFGASGIALFLLAAYQATDREDLLRAARGALEFDLRCATKTDLGYAWGEDSKDPSIRPYWLRGSTGIGTVLSCFHQVLGEARYGDWAEAVARESYTPFCVLSGLFEGLSGIGDFQIEMYRITEDETYLRAAFEIARSVLLFAVERPTGIAFPGKRTDRLSADLGWGSAGVGFFLSRLVNPSAGRPLYTLAHILDRN
jgi:lantibiotic modifying enzyme